MAIEGKGTANIILLHQGERDTISKANPLVGEFLEKIDCRRFVLIIWPKNQQRAGAVERIRLTGAEGVRPMG